LATEEEVSSAEGIFSSGGLSVDDSFFGPTSSMGIDCEERKWRHSILSCSSFVSGK